MATQDSTKTDRRATLINGLREFADWLDTHPDARLPDDNDSWRVRDPQFSREGLVERVRVLGGKWEKEADDSIHFRLLQRFGPIAYQVYAGREDVCERVVTGIREVTVDEPDPDAVAALPKITRTETVEEVEWRCPDSLLGAAREAVA